MNEKKFLFALILATALISTTMAQENVKTIIMEDTIHNKPTNYWRLQSVALSQYNLNTKIRKNMLKNVKHPSFVFFITIASEQMYKASKIPNSFVLFEGRSFMNDKEFTIRADYRGHVIEAGISPVIIPKIGSVLDAGVFGFKKLLKPLTDTIYFDFEAGKSYLFYIKKDKENIIDCIIEETTNYLTYQEANPNKFEGTWSGVKKVVGYHWAYHYSFDGKKLKYVYEYVRHPKPAGYEGSVIYDENTIIFIPEKAFINGKEKNNDFYLSKVFTLDYTLTDNELQIHTDEGSLAEGSFQKVKE